MKRSTDHVVGEKELARVTSNDEEGGAALQKHDVQAKAVTSNDENGSLQVSLFLPLYLPPSFSLSLPLLLSLPQAGACVTVFHVHRNGSNSMENGENISFCGTFCGPLLDRIILIAFERA